MKHTILWIAALLACMQVIAQKKLPGTDLSGSWQEVRRMDAKSNVVPFADTLHIDFLAGRKYEWLRDGGFTYKGDYTALNGQLDMGMRFFTIVRRMPGQLVLKDDSGTYEMRNYTKAQVKTDNTAAANAARADAAVGSLGEVNKNELPGNWESYKTYQKQEAGGAAPDRARLIKKIIIYANGKTIGGTVFPGQPGQQWGIERMEGNMIYCASGADKRVLEVLKCAGGELIIKEGNTTYYFKVFAKR